MNASLEMLMKAAKESLGVQSDMEKAVMLDYYIARAYEEGKKAMRTHKGE